MVGLMVTSSKRAYAIPKSASPSHTHVCFTQSPCPCDSPLLTYTSTGDTQTQFCLSLGLWILVCTRFVWALWASLAAMGFDSNHEFAPPTILLGLLLCPWTWHISSKLLQRLAATTPAWRTLRRSGVAIIVNKIVWNAVLGCNLKNDRMISIHFQGTPFNIMVIKVYALASNTEEAEQF